MPHIDDLCKSSLLDCGPRPKKSFRWCAWTAQRVSDRPFFPVGIILAGSTIVARPVAWERLIHTRDSYCRALDAEAQAIASSPMVVSLVFVSPHDPALAASHRERRSVDRVNKLRMWARLFGSLAMHFLGREIPVSTPIQGLLWKIAKTPSYRSPSSCPCRHLRSLRFLVLANSILL